MQQRIAIVGGTGFVGRHIASELARRGHYIRVLTRRRERDRDLIVIPRLELVETEVHSTAALSDALTGCDAVINLAGILHGAAAPTESFEGVHARLPGRIAEAAAFNRMSRVLHMCALGAAEDAPSEYLRSKARGEAALFAHEDLAVTSFRPSVIFGPGDSFFNQFATLLTLSPGVFPLACAQARFAPAYVGDVARAFVDCLEERKGIGESFELCGPRDYSLEELVNYTARCAGVRRVVVGLGDSLSEIQSKLLGLLPRPMFTHDNYLSMQVPSVCSDGGFARLGIQPASVESVVPGYLGNGSRMRLYGRLRRGAGR